MAKHTILFKELKLYTYIFIFFLVLVTCDEAFGQQLEVKGTVVDAATAKPLPFATISIGNSSRGTTANAEGNFKLIVPQAFLTDELLITFLGYKQKRISISTITAHLTVSLAAEERVLKEVVIMPDSSLTVFLREAYNSIKKNYSTKPYELEGFYRESLKTPDGQHNYFGEVQLLLQTSGYQYNDEEGAVKILRSRINNFTDTLPSYYYGGPFIGCWGDVVKRKPGYLKPNTKEYTYQLSDILVQNGREVWVIKVTQDRQPAAAWLYIEKESKAYIKIESTDSTIRKKIGRSRTQRSLSTVYRKINNKWFLQYTTAQVVDYSERYRRNEVVTAEFSVNKIALDTFQRISLNDRLNYGQLFAMIKNDFSLNFWNGTTTLVQDSTLVNQIAKHSLISINHDSLKVNENQKDKRKALLNIVTRLGVNFGIQPLPYPLKDNKLSLAYTSDGNLSNYNSLPFPSLPILLVSGYSFRLSKRYEVFVNNAISIPNNYMFKSFASGLRCSFQLPVKGNPLLARVGLGYSQSSFGQGFPRISQSEILFEGKKYDYKNMRFFVGEKVSSMQLSLSLDKKLKGKKWLYFNTAYQLELKSQDLLFLRKEGFFFNKLHSVNLNNSETTVLKNGVVETKNLYDLNKLSFEMGIRLKF